MHHYRPNVTMSYNVGPKINYSNKTKISSCLIQSVEASIEGCSVDNMTQQFNEQTINENEQNNIEQFGNSYIDQDINESNVVLGNRCMLRAWRPMYFLAIFKIALELKSILQIDLC